MIPTPLKALSLVALIMGLSVPGKVQAQAIPVDRTQATRLLDQDNVDMTSGTIIRKQLELSIGPNESSLVLEGSNWDMTLTRVGEVIVATTGDMNVKFYPERTTSFGNIAKNESGETIEFHLQDGYALYINRTGDKFRFNTIGNEDYVIAEAQYANGYKVTFHQLLLTFCEEDWQDLNGDEAQQPNEISKNPCYLRSRLQSVTDNRGYQIKFTYKVDYPHNSPNLWFYEYDPWAQRTGAVAVNQALEYCNPQADQCTLQQNWSRVQYLKEINPSTGQWEDVLVLPEGRRWRTIFHRDANYEYWDIQRPGSNSFDYNYRSTLNSSRTITLNNAGIVHRYVFDASAVTFATDTNVMRATREAPSGATIATETTTYLRTIPNCFIGPNANIPCTSWFVDENVTQLSNGTGAVTGMLYDRIAGRKQQTVLPDGRVESYEYDSRGNVVRTRLKAKPGDSATDIVTESGFDSECVYIAKCNKPNWTRDNAGGVTDYTYDLTTGQVLTITSPAPQAGAPRPQTRNRYAYFQSYFNKNGNGLVASGEPISLLISSSICHSGSSCEGTPDETVTEFGYGTAGQPNNLNLASKVVRTGNNATAMTESYSYDYYGNQIAIDGPKSGSDDTTFMKYDMARRLIATAGPDPDGPSGPLLPIATRFTYDLGDRVLKTESGNLPNQTIVDWGAMIVREQTDVSYDARGNKVREVRSAGGIAYWATHYSYDGDDRLECTAVRMDPSQWASQSNACVPQLNGPNGPDRITRNVYNAANQVVQRQQAVGTSIQQNHVTYTYSLTGKQTSVTDANGNKAALTYDGFDRQSGWYFPDKVTIGVVSTTDYEAYGYDANGNRTSHRKRDGRVLTLQYDALNRVTAKLVPDGCAPLQAGACPPASATRDVYYGYDLRGLQLYARFDSPGGEGVTNSYDAFGRQTSTTTAMGGLSATIGHDYDANGNQLGTTYPDGQRFGFGYDGVNRQVSVTDPSGTINIQAVFNDQGQLATLTRAVGASSYGYDPIGRLTLASHAFTPSSLSTSTTLGYNPASQITSQTRSNNAYVWTGAYNINRPYSVNGLNQYTSAGTASFSYDANGNLISQVTPEGTVSYGYDVENRLISSSQGVALRYDPLGRLFEVQRASELTRFVHDNDAIIAEYGAANQLLNRYVHGAGVDDPLIWYEGSTTATSVRRFLFANHQGSVIATTNPSGSGVAINAYDDYGIPDQRNTGRFQYTGQAWLNELGMYYYKARIYSPSLGRFLQTDPIGYDDQINLYAYVANDPVNMTDPSGKCGVGNINTCLPNAHPPEETPIQQAGRLAYDTFISPFVSAFNLVTGKGSGTDAANVAVATVSLAVPALRVAGKGIKVAGQGAAATVNGSERIFRFGTSFESPARLNKKATEAVAAGLPHGVSGSTRDLGPTASSASRSTLEAAGFKVTKTGGKDHVTIELPRPVTKSCAKDFNDCFGRK